MTGPWTADNQPETKSARTWRIVGGVVLATIVVIVAFLAGLGWEEATNPDGDTSVAQQQQAWEEDVERDTCEMWHSVGEDYFELQQSLGTRPSGQRPPAATPQLSLSGCSGETYGRVLHDQIKRRFEDSPAWDSGETYATWYRE